LAEHSKIGKAGPLVRFIVGLCLLLGVLVASSAGLIPSDGMGGVIEHNMANKIDATPLIYSDSEDMPRLEEGVMDCLKGNERK
jgi:hypothetical protein